MAIWMELKIVKEMRLQADFPKSLGLTYWEHGRHVDGHLVRGG